MGEIFFEIEDGVRLGFGQRALKYQNLRDSRLGRLNTQPFALCLRGQDSEGNSI